MTQRMHKPGMDVLGVVAWLFNLLPILFWVTWVLSAVFAKPGPYQAVFAANLTERSMLYVVILGFPLLGELFGLASLNQRRRRSDLGVVAVPLSLLLLGAGLLYSIVRVYHP